MGADSAARIYDCRVDQFSVLSSRRRCCRDGTAATGIY